MYKGKLIKSAITITDSAINRIKYLLSENKDPSIIGLNLSTKLRGCNGSSYVLNYAKEKKQFDEHIHHKGVDIYIDNKALLQVIGTEMDFVEDRIKSEFIFRNPNAKGTCGCGESFNT